MSSPDPGVIEWSGLVLPGLGEGRVAFVTGGTGAIGWRVVEVMASLGMRVGVMSRSRERVRDSVNQVPAELRDRLLAVPGDVASRTDAEACVQAVVGRWGRLDVLVHAAAIANSGAGLAGLTEAEIDTLLAINVKGTLMVAQAAAVPMREQGGGCMVLVGSVAASRASAGGTIYGATKAAVIRLVRQLAVELGPEGIRVNSISPGQTPTVLRAVGEPSGGSTPASPGGNEATIPLRRRGRLDDYVGVIAFLASDLAAYVTGTDVLVDGGVAVRR